MRLALKTDSTNFLGAFDNRVRLVDDAIDRVFDRWRGDAVADKVFYAASELADYSVGWHLLSGGSAILNPSLERHALRMSACLGVESLLVNGIIKPIFKRDRPDLIEGAPALRRPKTASFPSGHASSGVVAATMMSAAIPQLRPLWWVLGGVVAASRIHTRMHHASDVAGGLIAGAVVAGVTKRVWPL